MESLCKSVLISTVVTLFQLLAVVVLTSATSTAPTECPEKCGNVSISYPFGINDGCFREGFKIICSETLGTTSTIDGYEIIDISISQAQMRIYNCVAYSCNYTKREDDVSYDSYLSLSDRYRLSNTRNKFTAVGCQTFAILYYPYSGSIHTPKSYITTAGCISLCTNKSKFVDNSPCSGVRCCQTTLTEGLSYYGISFKPDYLEKAKMNYSPCSYAFVAEEGFYNFLQSDTEHGNLYHKRFQQAPLVLDWVLGNETCKEARLNKSGDYAYLSLESTCKDSQNGPGYTCSCSPGYQGNPYIHGDGGCTTSTVPTKYPEKCGNVSISYPFGINDGCFREGFKIICNETSGTASTIDGNEIIDISISQAQMRIYNYVGYSCNYTKREHDLSLDSYLSLSDRYRLSNTHNKFTTVGCQTFAILYGVYSGSIHTPKSYISTAGCISLCTNQSRFVDSSPCSGIGCYQTTLPERLSYYIISFKPDFLEKAKMNYSPCIYAFVAEEGFYSFLQSDT